MTRCHKGQSKPTERSNKDELRITNSNDLKVQAQRHMKVAGKGRTTKEQTKPSRPTRCINKGSKEDQPL